MGRARHFDRSVSRAARIETVLRLVLDRVTGNRALARALHKYLRWRNTTATPFKWVYNATRAA